MSTKPTLDSADIETDKATVVAICTRLLASLKTSGPEGRAAFLATLAPHGTACHGRKMRGGGHGFEYEPFPEGFANRIPWDLPPGAMEESLDGAPTVLLDHDLAMVWTPYWVTMRGELSHVGTNCFQLLKERWEEGGEEEWRVCGMTDTARKPTEEDRRRLGF
jgi:hypothetical protein